MNERNITYTRRKGVSIIESVILMIVLGITLAGLLSVLEWGSKSYVFAQTDIKRKALLANWGEAFETVYPDRIADPFNALGYTASLLGGTWSSFDKTFTVQAMQFKIEGMTSTDGILSMDIKISDGGSKRYTRSSVSFNMYSNEVASDDKIGN